jgi:hypothetical protein
MKSARTSDGRGRVAFFVWTLGATVPAACLPVDRPEKATANLARAGTAGSTAVVSAQTERPAMGTDQSSGEMLPNISGVEPIEAAGSRSTEACTEDAGACSPTSDAGTGPNCFGCVIQGECVAVDAVEPENQCQICDPDRDPLGWSNNDGVACDDGLFCTVDDACRAGACEGTARICEDGVACNDVSTCIEDSESCSPPVSQCGNNAVCDTATDSCQSTCNGCVISGVCVAAGTEAPGNPCQVCDPSRSSATYSIVAGKSCGASATDCSGQDTCDAQGRCQLNHRPSNTSCGNPNSGACDQADACDGNGNCQQRTASNGAPCEDGAFCTVGDQCQGGRCVAGGNRSCGANQTCSNASNACVCQGCQIGNTCFTAGATNPSNPCQVCDPNRSPTAFSVNAGASCGAGPTECSGQDTCNSQGQCVASNVDGTDCTSASNGTCRAGQCVAGPDEFDCSSASPPQCPLPPFTISSATPPTPRGGTIADGRYQITQVTFFTTPGSVRGETLDFSGNFFQRNSTTYFANTGQATAGFVEVGTFVTTGTSLATDATGCNLPGNPRNAEIWGYSVNGSRLDIIKGFGPQTVVETYARIQ